MAQSVDVGRNIQLTVELIAIQVELGQIDEVAELLGQFACKKQTGGMSAKRTNTCMLRHTIAPVNMFP